MGRNPEGVTISARDVESYRKFSAWHGSGGAHVAGETVRIGVFVKYRPSSQDRRRLRWAVVAVPGFLARNRSELSVRPCFQASTRRRSIFMCRAKTGRDGFLR